MMLKLTFDNSYPIYTDDASIRRVYTHTEETILDNFIMRFIAYFIGAQNDTVIFFIDPKFYFNI